MLTLQWLIGAVMCFGSFFIVQPIATWWVGQHSWPPIDSKERLEMAPDRRRIYDERQRALYETGTTFGSILAVCIFVGGIIVGNL